jgi:flagellar hook-length control protein FliK
MVDAVLPDAGAPSERSATPSPFQPLSPLTVQPFAGPGVPQNLGAALAAQVLDMGRSGQWIDQLAQDISRAASSDGAMRFRLAPETLGELRVEITQSERGAHIRLNVSSEAAQQALAEAQPKLLAEARGQGLRIAEAEISFTGGQSQGRETSQQAQGRQETPAMRTTRGARPETDPDATRATSRQRADRYA